MAGGGHGGQRGAHGARVGVEATPAHAFEQVAEGVYLEHAGVAKIRGEREIHAEGERAWITSGGAFGDVAKQRDGGGTGALGEQGFGAFFGVEVKVGDRAAGEAENEVAGAAADDDDAHIEGAAGEAGLGHPGLDVQAFAAERIHEEANLAEVAIGAQASGGIETRGVGGAGEFDGGGG